MKNTWVFLLGGALGCLVLAGYLTFRTPSESVQGATDGSFDKDVLKSDIPVLVDFWAVWCGPCRMASPIVDKMGEEFKGKLKVVKVDVDKNPELSQKYQIRAIPTLLIFQKGALAKSWVGLMPEETLRSGIQSVLAGQP